MRWNYHRRPEKPRTRYGERRFVRRWAIWPTTAWSRSEHTWKVVWLEGYFSEQQYRESTSSDGSWEFIGGRYIDTADGKDIAPESV